MAIKHTKSGFPPSPTKGVGRVERAYGHAADAPLDTKGVGRVKGAYSRAADAPLDKKGVER